MKRKFDVVRIRKDLLPKSATEKDGAAAVAAFKKLFSDDKTMEVKEDKTSLIIWKTVEE